VTYRPWRNSRFWRGSPRPGTINGEPRWINSQGDRIYTWDSLHGEVECFNKRGYHLGVLDPKMGKLIKPAVKGRRIDV
jgi:hypothetical protein